MHRYMAIGNSLKMSLESCIENVISYWATSGSNCVNPVIATYFFITRKRGREMKRVQAACICQTLHFFQKDEPSKERNEKLSREEIEKYKKSLEQSRTDYRVLEEKKQDDGSIVIKVIKQYNNSPVGDYLK